MEVLERPDSCWKSGLYHSKSILALQPVQRIKSHILYRDYWKQPIWKPVFIVLRRVPWVPHGSIKIRKGNKECLVGDADNGKASLAFFSILSIIYYSNVAMIAREKVFNKAIISKEIKVILVNKVSPPMLDVDDWTIPTQGGFTACKLK